MSDDQDFTCEPGYLLFATDLEPGDTWRTLCEADAARMTGTGEVIGFDTRNVAGTSVEKVHVRIIEQASVSSTGPSSNDYWFRLSDGLLVERVSSVETRCDSQVGTATYTESFTLRLTSLTPRT
jgi:hypothetical protein